MDLAPLVLALLEAGPLHGYEIVRRARKLGPLRWEEGTLYPLLHRLERERLLAAQWRKAPNGKDRKYYRLSRKGRRALARARASWVEEARAVSRILMGGSHD